MTSAVSSILAPTAPPGLSFPTPFHFTAALRRDILGLFFECRQRFGDVVRLRAPLASAYLLCHPDHVKHVLQDNHRNYWKGDVFGRLRRIAGNGVLFSEGELWRRQRKLMQPAFQKPRIEAMDHMMTDAALEAVSSWRARPGEPVEIAHEMSGIALDVVTRALLGSGTFPNRDEFRQGVNDAIAYANYLINGTFPPPLWVPTPRNRRVLRTRALLWRTLDGIVAERRARGGGGDDLLGSLLAARDDETHEGMDDVQLRDELITIINAGHETTGMALAWTWWQVSVHPGVERRLHEELEQVLGGRAPRASDLPRLVYTRAVIEESMRLYPPAWGTGRQSYEADEIGGYRIEPKSFVFVSPYLTHRDPRFWDNPEAFDPERFLPERAGGRPRYAYFPFGGGPRMCMGSVFAMVEMQLVLAAIAQRVVLRLVPGHPVVPDPIFTLRPKHGIRMTVHPR